MPQSPRRLAFHGVSLQPDTRREEAQVRPSSPRRKPDQKELFPVWGQVFRAGCVCVCLSLSVCLSVCLRSAVRQLGFQGRKFHRG